MERPGPVKVHYLSRWLFLTLNEGMAFVLLDPQGDIAEHILHYIPKHRIPDVIYFNATDSEHFIAFNPLATNASQQSDNLITSNLISTFKKNMV